MKESDSYVQLPQTSDRIINKVNKVNSSYSSKIILSAKDINKETAKGETNSKSSKFDIRQLNNLENLEFVDSTGIKKVEKVEQKEKAKKSS